MWPELGKTLDYRLRLYMDKWNTKKLLCTDPETKKYLTTIGPTKSEKYLLFAEKAPEIHQFYALSRRKIHVAEIVKLQFLLFEWLFGQKCS